jgi:GNAT superfamily N-acetyltransferase
MARIRPLSEKPEYAPVLAYWSYTIWYRKRPIEYDLIIKAYAHRAQDGGLPLAWFAEEESMPVGMVSLKENDLWSRRDLNPWLASLYVLPEFRRRGVADGLMRAVIERSRGEGFPRIYLFLGQEEQSSLAGYYTRRGWKYSEDALDNDGCPTGIYFFNL